jgi:hypothetical protein
VNIVGPFRVIHEGIVVIPDDDRLSIEVPDGNHDKLSRALEMCRQTIKYLPRTPLRAAWIMLHYACPCGQSDPASSFWRDWDSALKKSDHEIIEREAGRLLSWRGGNIAIRLRHRVGDEADVFLRFEKKSDNHKELEDWLSLPIEEVQREAEALVQALRQEVLQ